MLSFAPPWCTVGFHCFQYVHFFFCNHVSAEDRSLRLVHSVHSLYLNVAEIIEFPRIFYAVASSFARKSILPSLIISIGILLSLVSLRLPFFVLFHLSSSSNLFVTLEGPSLFCLPALRPFLFHFLICRFLIFSQAFRETL
jgi:hypothetical protein